MKHASFPTTKIAPPAAIPALPKLGKVGLFKWLLQALHHSRRLQAQRFLTTHRHLLDSSDSSGQSGIGDGHDVDR